MWLKTANAKNILPKIRYISELDGFIIAFGVYVKYIPTHTGLGKVIWR